MHGIYVPLIVTYGGAGYCSYERDVGARNLASGLKKIFKITLLDSFLVINICIC